jgi:hypothetical protein
MPKLCKNHPDDVGSSSGRVMLHRGVKRFRNFSRLRLRRSTWSEVKQASSENGGVTTWTTAAAFGKYRNARDADDAVSSTPTAVAAMAAELPSNAVATFFPAGYPGSVKEGYLQYVQLSVAGAVASSAGSVLSMQALLHAVGLGSGAIPMAAALNWVIKDGIGQLGGVIFAATVNTKFDGDPKRWRMVSSLALDTACMLELLAPAVPALFIPMAATANFGKNVSWLAASASRAAIHNSFAVSTNLADITAKTGSQNIAASLAGTALGISLSAHLGGAWGLHTVTTFAVLSAVHIGCTYQSLKSVRLETLNSQRLDLVIAHYVANVEGLCADASPAASDVARKSSLLSAKRNLLTPSEVSTRERFLPNCRSLREATRGIGLEDWLIVGPPLPHVASTPSDLAEVQEATTGDGGLTQGPRDGAYMLTALLARAGASNVSGIGTGSQACIMLLLDESASFEDCLRASVHARLVRNFLQIEQQKDKHGGTRCVQFISMPPPPSLLIAATDTPWRRRLDAVSRTADLAGELSRALMEELMESEWRTDVLHVDELTKRAGRLHFPSPC